MYPPLSINQKSRGFSREVTVDGINYLTVTDKSLLRKHEVPINLEVLEPKPLAHRELPRKPVYWAVLFFIAAVLFFYIARQQSTEFDSDSFDFVAAMFGAIAVLIAISAVRGFTDLLVYTNRANGGTVFVLQRNRPSKKVVDEFVIELEQRINAIRYPANLPWEQKLDIYLRHLTFLRDETVLTEIQYREIVEELQNRPKSGNVFKLV